MAKMTVDVDDNSKEVERALENQLKLALDAIGYAAESNAKILCPVDTGRLRSSITHEVEDDAVIVGTNVEYGKYVEYDDHVYHPNGQAHYLRDGVINKKSDYEQILKRYLQG